MFKSIKETLQWTEQLLTHGIKPGTLRMEWMLEKLDHPERRIRAIHVGGTNGKGSTVSFLKHIYQAAGYTIGTFTSPALTRFNERITVDGQEISDDDLIEAGNIIYPLVKELEQTALGTPTEFEVVTMISIVYFARMTPCDLVIYEVGLGGRLDSTNVITPLVSIITNIGMDHMTQLGNTLESIAMEKAGIIKSGVAVITAAHQPNALEVIRQAAKKRQAKIYEYGTAFDIEMMTDAENGQQFHYRSVFKAYKNLGIKMKGRHQLINAAVALMAIDYLRTYYSILVDEKDIINGLKQTTWPGRFEVVSVSPNVVLDGAHNPEGAGALANAVNHYYKDKTINTLYASLSDKDNDTMVKEIEGISDHITFTTFDFPRAAEPEVLEQLSSHPNKKHSSNWQDTLKQMMKHAGKNDVLLVTGSLYFIAEVRQYLVEVVQKVTK